ncbi:MAG: GTP cyclohydrolase I FolE [Thermoanaerobaculia bacterium]
MAIEIDSPNLALKNGHTEDDPRIEQLAAHVKEMIKILGLCPDQDPNLIGTDRRVAKMYLDIFSGLDAGTKPNLTTLPNEEHYTAMVMEKEIPFYSMCAHHFVPFYGHGHIAYIPNEKIVGLSKLPRLLEFFARRPQLQERLTEQVARVLEEELRPQGVMVVIEARHLCVEMRGVKKPGAVTVTSAIRGIFLQKAVREEFLDLLRHRNTS